MLLKLSTSESRSEIRASFEICWRRMEKFIWNNRVKNDEVLHRVKEDRNILETMKRRKASWICCILHGNYLRRLVIEKKIDVGIEVEGKWGRRRKQRLGDFKKKKGCWKLKEDALGRTIWRVGFGRDCGPVVRQIAGWRYVINIVALAMRLSVLIVWNTACWTST